MFGRRFEGFPTSFSLEPTLYIFNFSVYRSFYLKSHMATQGRNLQIFCVWKLCDSLRLCLSTQIFMSSSYRAISETKNFTIRGISSGPLHESSMKIFGLHFEGCPTTSGPHFQSTFPSFFIKHRVHIMVMNAKTHEFFFLVLEICFTIPCYHGVTMTPRDIRKM